MKEELELLRSIQTSEAQLDKIEADIQKAKKESDRRGVFIEGAFYDAFIEIVERLREELRGRSDNSKEIAKIKKEIAELRKVVMLNADDLHVDTANLQAMKQPNDE
jgi:hypothetical protein